MEGMPRVILLIGQARGFERGLLTGISRYAADRGPWLFQRPSPAYLGGGGGVRESLAEMAAQGADGIICRARRLPDTEGLGLPVVIHSVDEEVDEGAAAIITDHESAGRLAAEHLMGLGLRDFAFCGYKTVYWSRKRQRAFVQTLKAAGHACQVYHRNQRRARWTSKAAPVAGWLSGLPKPVGLLCANDDLTAPVADCCHASGLSVPDEVAILGVDNDEYVCGLGSPPLSSVALDTESAGYHAAELLGRMMAGTERVNGQRITARATHVVTRRSTDVLAVDDPILRRALRFIRQNANRVVRVADVVAATGGSHRSLNERFRRALGHSIIKELTRLRIEHICRLLVETNFPVARIARDLGYPNHRHIARYFHRAMGMTPSEYRSRHRPVHR